MNWDQIEGNWTRLRGKAREKWGELTDDDLDRISGKKDQLVGALQQRYGRAKDDAERDAEGWANMLDEAETRRVG